MFGDPEDPIDFFPPPDTPNACPPPFAPPTFEFRPPAAEAPGLCPPLPPTLRFFAAPVTGEATPPDLPCPPNPAETLTPAEAPGTLTSFPNELTRDAKMRMERKKRI